MLKLVAAIALSLASLQPKLPPLPEVPPARVMPREVKAVYATAYTARGARLQELRQLIKTTELNAIIINTKEPSGPKLDGKLAEVVRQLHDEGVWVIARHVVFQDDELAARDTRVALKRAGGNLWRDGGGRTWVDPSSRDVWQYNLEIAKRTLELGFDEINLDYIRFPTDGDTKAIKYPVWDGKKIKEDVIAEFAGWFSRELKRRYPQAVVSADVFGYTFVEDWDVGMGQRIKKMSPEVDVISPMIYPSHYYGKNFGFQNPAEHPYEIAYQTLIRGKKILGEGTHALVRPWFQDFDMGAEYTPERVRAQFTALKDAGYTSGWMLWNPSNIYTKGALLPE